MLLELAGHLSRPALHVIVAGSVVVLVANVGEWRHQHGRSTPDDAGGKNQSPPDARSVSAPSAASRTRAALVRDDPAGSPWTPPSSPDGRHYRERTGAEHRPSWEAGCAAAPPRRCARGRGLPGPCRRGLYPVSVSRRGAGPGDGWVPSSIGVGGWIRARARVVRVWARSWLDRPSARDARSSAGEVVRLVKSLGCPVGRRDCCGWYRSSWAGPLCRLGRWLSEEPSAWDGRLPPSGPASVVMCWRASSTPRS